MTKMWRFVREPRNLAVLIAIGAGVGFLWTAVVEPGIHREKTRDAEPSQQADANGGGIALNAAGQAQVTVSVVGSPVVSTSAVALPSNAMSK